MDGTGRRTRMDKKIVGLRSYGVWVDVFTHTMEG